MSFSAKRASPPPEAAETTGPVDKEKERRRLLGRSSLLAQGGKSTLGSQNSGRRQLIPAGL